jgi:hypothetical protein
MSMAARPLLSFALAASLGAFAACGGGRSLAHRVPEDLLDGLASNALSEARTRAATADIERVKLDNARIEAASARLELVRARNALEVAERRLSAEERLLDAASDAKVETQVKASEKMVKALAQLVEAREAGVKVKALALEAAKLNTRLAEARLLAAEAQVEAARAEAAAQTPSGQALDRAKFAQQTSDALSEAASLEKKSADMFDDVREADEEYVARLKKTPDAADADAKRMEALETDASKLRDELARAKEKIGQLENIVAELRRQLEAAKPQ